MSLPQTAYLAAVAAERLAMGGIETVTIPEDLRPKASRLAEEAARNLFLALSDSGALLAEDVSTDALRQEAEQALDGETPERQFYAPLHYAYEALAFAIEHEGDTVFRELFTAWGYLNKLTRLVASRDEIGAQLQAVYPEGREAAAIVVSPACEQRVAVMEQRAWKTMGF